MVYYIVISHIGDYMLLTTVYTYVYNCNYYAFDMCIMTYYKYNNYTIMIM